MRRLTSPWTRWKSTRKARTLLRGAAGAVSAIFVLTLLGVALPPPWVVVPAAAAAVATAL